MERDLVNYYKSNYHKGDKVLLISMKGEPQMSFGLLGIVDFVDDIGKIHVSWNNHSSLVLSPEEDKWVKVV